MHLRCWSCQWVAANTRGRSCALVKGCQVAVLSGMDWRPVRPCRNCYFSIHTCRPTSPLEPLIYTKLKWTFIHLLRSGLLTENWFNKADLFNTEAYVRYRSHWFGGFSVRIDNKYSVHPFFVYSVHDLEQFIKKNKPKNSIFEEKYQPLLAFLWHYWWVIP